MIRFVTGRPGAFVMVALLQWVCLRSLTKSARETTVANARYRLCRAFLGFRFAIFLAFEFGDLTA